MQKHANDRTEKTFDISINNHKLQNLFYEYYDNIRSYHGWNDLIGKFSFLLSLVLLFVSDISFWNISNQVFKVISVLGIVYIIYDIIKYFIRKHNDYDLWKLYDKIVEKSKNVYPQEFITIFILKRNNNNVAEYLVYQDDSWECKLFPNTVYDPVSNLHAQRSTLQMTIASLLDVGKEQVSLEILEDFIRDSQKLNKGKKHISEYHFKFVYVHINNVTNGLKNRKTFTVHGKKYSWMTFPELEAEKNNVEYNNDVIRYLIDRENVLISKPVSL